jgi:hypothetical protein
LTDLDANWVVVGTVTADEVAAAIGDGNATHPLQMNVVPSAAAKTYMEDLTPMTGGNR